MSSLSPEKLLKLRKSNLFLVIWTVVFMGLLIWAVVTKNVVAIIVTLVVHTLGLVANFQWRMRVLTKED